MENSKNSSLSKLIPVMLCFFAMGFVDLVGIASNYVKADLGLSDSQANIFPSLVFFWFLIFSVPTGMLMSRIGQKKTVLLSLIVTFASLLLPVFGDSYMLMLISFSLLGIGNALMQTSLNPLLSNIVRGDRLASSLTFGQFVKAIASFLAPYIAMWGATQAILTFEFSALNYINHERTYYRYQLEGIDPQWMSTFAGRQGNATVGKGLLQAVYTNLPPGDYTFKVMASDNPLQWNGKVTAIKLTIHAPWWKTTTAYILYAVILLLIAFTGIRLYIYWSRKEMERKHKEEILLLRIRNLIEQVRILPQGGRQGEAIHMGHLDVRQNRVERFALRLSQSVAPVFRQGDTVA